MLFSRGGEEFDRVPEAFCRQLVSMEAPNRIAAGVTIHLGQVPNGSAGADQPGAGCEAAHRHLPEMTSNVLAEAPNLLARRRIGCQELLAETEGAERQAHRFRAAAIVE